MIPTSVGRTIVLAIELGRESNMHTLVNTGTSGRDEIFVSTRMHRANSSVERIRENISNVAGKNATR